jgi:2-(1,2-epoxy-1,2-dihydrophenyl)acetyl-CoA isomerase
MDRGFRMFERPLIVSREGPVASIQMTQPQTLNAITLRSASALLEAFRGLASDKSLRVVLLSGAGRAFMAGGDLNHLESTNPKGRAENAAALIECLHTIIELMVSFPVPILSMVHGVVAGAGLGLMLASDLTIAAQDTRFVFAYSDLGTSPDGGLTWFLARMIGVRRALQFALLRTQLDAEEALRLGLVQELLDSEALTERGRQLALQLSELPRQAFLRTRRLLLESSERTLRQQLDAEQNAFVLCAESDDFAEGILAFRQRRRPQFS